MSELRNLHPFCICGGPPTYKCRRCQSKKYCSKTCQERDWPLHKLQCTNEQLVSSVLDNRGTAVATIPRVAELMKQPNWQRWLLVTYDSLRRRGGPNAEPHEYYVYWLRVARPEAESLVAFVWLAQEPTRLFMHVSKDYTANEFGVVQADGDLPPKELLDEDCVVFDADIYQGKAPRAMSSLVYPLHLRRPDKRDGDDDPDWEAADSARGGVERSGLIPVVDWELRGQN